MSFETELQKNSNTPVVLFQIYKSGTVLDFFTTYSSHTWFLNLDAIYPNIRDDFLDGVEEENIKGIIKVYIDGSMMDVKTSISDVEDNENTFYYDGNNRNLYVHLTENSRPSLHAVTADTILFAYRKSGDTDYYGGTYYEDRIKSIPSLTRKKEDIYNARFNYGGGTVSLANEDGNFDNTIENQDIFKENCKLLLGFDGLDISEFIDIYTGFIEDVNLSTSNFDLSIKDEKKKFNTSVTPSTFETSTYPYLNEDNIGSVIPVAYGSLRSVPVICTNEEEPGASTFNFKICDTTYHSIKDITTVSVNGSSVAFAGEDLNNATFTISSANYSPGDEVTVLMEGYVNDSGDLIENALDIIADMIVNYNSVTFDNTYFNLARWEQSRAFNINFFANENKKLSEAIQEISISSLITFLVEDDGRYSARIFDSTAAILDTYTNEDIFDYVSIDYDLQEMITSVNIKYDKNYSNNEFSSFLDDSLETSLLESYNYEERRGYETTLLNRTDASSYAGLILEQRGLLYKSFSIQTKLDAIYRQVGDIVNVTLARPQAPDMGTWTCEVIEMTKLVDKFSIKLGLRPFSRFVDLDKGQSAYYFDFGDSSEDGSYYNEDPEDATDIYSTDTVAT